MKDGSLVSQVKDLQYLLSMGAAGHCILRQKEEMKDAAQACGMVQPLFRVGLSEVVQSVVPHIRAQRFVS